MEYDSPRENAISCRPDHYLKFASGVASYHPCRDMRHVTVLEISDQADSPGHYIHRFPAFTISL